MYATEVYLNGLGAGTVASNALIYLTKPMHLAEPIIVDY